jgi:WD40 repeat protein
VSLSLAQREVEFGAIRLHNLQLDYVRAQYPNREALALIHEAVRLSAHVIAKDRSQFASQVLGRLLSYRDQPAVREFAASLVEGAPRPWVRLLHPTLHPPGPPLIRTLEGHYDYVACVVVSPDGRCAVSASDDYTLKVWDLGVGTALATFTCDAPPQCCAFAGAHRIVAGDSAGRVHFLLLELRTRDPEVA